jgi:hypothetical protein
MPALLLKVSEWLLQRFGVPFLEWLGRSLRADWLRRQAAKHRKPAQPSPGIEESHTG